jgi:alpha-glucoside transport system substrate-binding protein
MSNQRKLLSLVLVLFVLAVLAACGGGATPTAEEKVVKETVVVEKEKVVKETAVVEKEVVVTATPAPMVAGEDTGTVFILGAFRGAEETAFQAVIDAFEAANPDIDVVYSGTGEFETLINVRVEAGDPPDIAAFPQPGAVARLARQGHLVPLWDEALALYDEQYTPAWKDLAAVDGTPYGMFHRVNAKGWIWYNKPLWNDAGWEIPQTWDEMMALSQRMADETDIAPWCDAIESQAATGWKGTDWIENIMLRTQPVETYDAWVAGELPFSSPEVTNAFQILQDIWFNPDLVYGGPQTIALTNFRDPAGWLFTDPPNCWMHMQGSFVTDFFPEDVQANLDEQVGVFMMPPIDESLPFTLEVGGDQYVVFTGHDRPEVKKFIEFLATPESVKPWAEQGGSLFPHINQDLSWYPTELERNMAEAITTATAARFDGSDNMASATNLAFWKGITDWVSGTRDLQGALADIDAAAAQ